MIGPNSGFSMSGITIPTDIVWFVRRPRASGWGRYPRRVATASTRSTVSGFTTDRVSGLRARDAVEVCTPASRATSLSVTRFATRRSDPSIPARRRS